MQGYKRFVSDASMEILIDALVEGVEQEDERDDGVGGRMCAVDRILRRADRLQGEEEGHAGRRREEQEAAAPAVDLERREDGPEQVPDSEDAGDEQLDAVVRDADGVEDLVQVVRYETVSGPLREPCNGHDDDHTLAVPAGRDKCLPADTVLRCERRTMSNCPRPTTLH